MTARPNPRLPLPAKPRILVVSLRRIGDALLTTPLIRSLRRAWPDAAIDVLTFAGDLANVNLTDLGHVVVYVNSPEQPLLPGAVKAKVVAEIDKDLIYLPARDLPKDLAEVLKL